MQLQSLCCFLISPSTVAHGRYWRVLSGNRNQLILARLRTASTSMTELSPAAEAVLDAAHREMDYAPRRHVQWVTAAALRAVAEHCKCDDGEGYWIYRLNILAIADELENQ